jgi:hypothetical protein
MYQWDRKTKGTHLIDKTTDSLDISKIWLLGRDQSYQVKGLFYVTINMHV